MWCVLLAIIISIVNSFSNKLKFRKETGFKNVAPSLLKNHLFRDADNDPNSGPWTFH